jgi:hypothetical protein
MRNDIEIHWWGVQAYLDENNTQQVLSLTDSGGDMVTVLMAIDPEIRSKAALALGAVCVKIGAKIIKAVDENGGKHGVVLNRPGFDALLVTCVSGPGGARRGADGTRPRLRRGAGGRGGA